MKTNFIELLEVQREVNEVVNERLDESGIERPSIVDYLVAMHVEVFEFINELGIWKWWKQSHSLNKERILDELADVMAFFLSIGSKQGFEDTIDIIFENSYDELVGVDPLDVVRSISIAIDSGEAQMNALTLMGVSLFLVEEILDATWDEVEAAYRKKSEENIRRQKEGY